MQPNLQVLEQRHEMPAEDLSNFVSTNFGGNLLTLRQLEPFIVEIKRRFKTLPRKMQVDGTYKTISGHRSFKVWCRGVLNRTDRTVRYMLAKSHEKATNQEQKSEQRAETISAVLDRCVKYLAKQRKLVTESKVTTTKIRKTISVLFRKVRKSKARVEDLEAQPRTAPGRRS